MEVTTQPRVKNQIQFDIKCDLFVKTTKYQDNAYVYAGLGTLH
jgi:hypothetical protein